MRSSPPLLAVTDLMVGFERYARGLGRDALIVVEGMSLTVAAGEVVALVGASGAGKTLLAHAVLGQLPSTSVESGEVAWRGEVLGAASRARLAGREIALLPQSLTALDPTATVGAQVRRSARLLGVEVEAAFEMLRTSGLEDSVRRLYPHQLSGGMARRVLRTMALVGDPALVIADEPTPGLGRREADDVLDLLRAQADAGRGVLLITHDLDVALRVTDRLVVARAGRTVAEAPAADFVGDGSRVSDPYARALWNALPSNGFRLPGVVAVSPSGPDAVRGECFEGPFEEPVEEPVEESPC